MSETASDPRGHVGKQRETAVVPYDWRAARHILGALSAMDELLDEHEAHEAFRAAAVSAAGGADLSLAAASDTIDEADSAWWAAGGDEGRAWALLRLEWSARRERRLAMGAVAFGAMMWLGMLIATAWAFGWV